MKECFYILFIYHELNNLFIIVDQRDCSGLIATSYSYIGGFKVNELRLPWKRAIEEYEKFKGIFTFGGDTSSYKGEERLL